MMVKAVGSTRRIVTVTLLLAAVLVLPGTASQAARPRCTIVGTQHADELFGTHGADVICGRGGDDYISAGGGDDIVYGGAGNDVVDGRGGQDSVWGGIGNDDLWGEVVVGGRGSDFCPDDQYWPTNRCDGDRVPVTVESVTLSPPTVDVTSQRVVVTVDVRMTDDIGLREVAILVTRPDGSTITPAWVYGRLRSGTPRDGIWRMRLPVPKGAVPDDYVVRLVYIARADGDFVEVPQAATLHVTDRDPDQDRPSVVEVASPAPDATVSLADPPVVRMHVTDDTSGVRAVTVAVFPSPGVGHTVPANRVEGNVLDGWWEVPLLMDGLSAGDHAAIVVGLQDKAGRYAWYVAPSWSWWLGQPGYSLLPGGVGDFVVVP